MQILRHSVTARTLPHNRPSRYSPVSSTFVLLCRLPRRGVISARRLGQLVLTSFAWSRSVVIFRFGSICFQAPPFTFRSSRIVVRLSATTFGCTRLPTSAASATCELSSQVLPLPLPALQSLRSATQTALGATFQTTRAEFRNDDDAPCVTQKAPIRFYATDRHCIPRPSPRDQGRCSHFDNTGQPPFAGVVAARAGIVSVCNGLPQRTASNQPEHR